MQANLKKEELPYLIGSEIEYFRPGVGNTKDIILDYKIFPDILQLILSDNIINISYISNIMYSSGIKSIKSTKFKFLVEFSYEEDYKITKWS